MGHFEMVSLWCVSVSTNTIDFALFQNEQLLSAYDVQDKELPNDPGKS